MKLRARFFVAAAAFSFVLVSGVRGTYAQQPERVTDREQRIRELEREVKELRDKLKKLEEMLEKKDR